MLCAIECMAPTIFNWCEGMLVSLKDQLNKCTRGKLKKFGYGVVLISFFLERVLLMRPQVAVSRIDGEALGWSGGYSSWPVTVVEIQRLLMDQSSFISCKANY